MNPPVIRSSSGGTTQSPSDGSPAHSPLPTEDSGECTRRDESTRDSLVQRRHYPIPFRRLLSTLSTTYCSLLFTVTIVYYQNQCLSTCCICTTTVECVLGEMNPLVIRSSLGGTTQSPVTALEHTLHCLLPTAYCLLLLVVHCNHSILSKSVPVNLL